VVGSRGQISYFLTICENKRRDGKNAEWEDRVYRTTEPVLYIWCTLHGVEVSILIGVGKQITAVFTEVFEIAYSVSMSGGL